MTISGTSDHWEVEMKALREELRELRAEQREMANAIQELVTTFRTLATHLGIASEPYQPKSGGSKGRDLPGFA